MQTRHDTFNSDPKSIDEVLHDRALDGIYRKTARLLRLQHIISNAMPEEYAAHCSVMNLQDGRLVVGVDSAAWATRMRYQTGILLERLREQPDCRDIQSIEFKVQHNISKRDEKPRTEHHLSNASRGVIRETASHIRDEGLRAMLVKLAR